MEIFLKSVDKRRLKILEYLAFSDDWVPLPQLATNLNTSIRIITTDIDFLKDHYPELGIQSMHKGIQIDLKYNYSLGTIYRKILQDTLAFQILQEIFFDEALNIQDLAYKFHASISSVYRTIVELNQYFKAFNVMIKTNPCQVIGDETYIRKFYRSFFKEAHTPLEWPFRDYDGKDFDDSLE